MLAKTYSGLEDVLAKELKALGGRNVKKAKRAVTFEGDIGFLYKATLWCRTAVRILVPISRFKIRSEEDLYRKVRGIDWENYFDADKTIVVDTTIFSKRFTHSLFIAQKTKDAIADRFREKTNKRPSVSTEDADIRINVHISNHNVTVSLDGSGESLHKRAYRSSADIAPVSEVLAAGILQLAGWKGDQDFIDPMCGSGTFLIEAALIAYNIPPNIFRKEYAFKHWKNYDSQLFGLIFDKALEKERDFHHHIRGFDKESRVVMKARRNVRNALMKEQIKIDKADFMTLEKPEDLGEKGIILFNPPYGVKMEADIPELYKGIGDTLKNSFQGYTAWIFTSSQEGIKNVGLKPSKKIPLLNGKLESLLVRYDLYEGSKKEAKGAVESA